MKLVTLIRSSTLTATLLLANCASLNGESSASSSTQIDASGVRAFYQVAERLLEDEVISETAWREFLETPGYAQHIAERQNSAQIREAIELALRPSMADACEQRLTEAGLGMQFMVANVRLAIEHRSEVEALMRELESPAVLDAILAESLRWLPEESESQTTPPRGYLVVLNGDSTASPESLILDIGGLAITGAPYAKLLFSHEFHHYYRNAWDRVDLDSIPLDDRPLIRLMERAETEGIADLIDKRAFVFGSGGVPARQQVHPLFAWMWKIYLPALQAAPGHMEELNQLLEQVHAGDLDRNRARSLENAASRLSVRPFGIFVADAVERHFGRERIAECVGDPFALFLAYAEAARSDPDLPSLSEQACQAIRDLRDSYATHS